MPISIDLWNKLWTTSCLTIGEVDKNYDTYTSSATGTGGFCNIEYKAAIWKREYDREFKEVKAKPESRAEKHIDVF